jgi:hypothetical protein
MKAKNTYIPTFSAFLFLSFHGEEPIFPIISTKKLDYFMNNWNEGL